MQRLGGKKALSGKGNRCIGLVYTGGMRVLGSLGLGTCGCYMHKNGLAWKLLWAAKQTASWKPCEPRALLLHHCCSAMAATNCLGCPMLLPASASLLLCDAG